MKFIVYVTYSDGFRTYYHGYSGTSPYWRGEIENALVMSADEALEAVQRVHSSWTVGAFSLYVHVVEPVQ